MIGDERQVFDSDPDFDSDSDEEAKEPNWH